MGVAQIMLDDLDLSNIVIGWYKLFGTSSLVSKNHRCDSQVRNFKFWFDSCRYETKELTKNWNFTPATEYSSTYWEDYFISAITETYNSPQIMELWPTWLNKCTQRKKMISKNILIQIYQPWLMTATHSAYAVFNCFTCTRKTHSQKELTFSPTSYHLYSNGPGKVVTGCQDCAFPLTDKHLCTCSKYK